MLTRLQINGFKNLVDVDVRFGPFTCIAGANGVGKSNLFDAIQFLSALANSSLIESAQSVRDNHTASIKSLFHRVGDHTESQMSFVADMIVPAEGIDYLEQVTKATRTFLRYSVTLAYRHDEERSSLGSLELIKEELAYLKTSDLSNKLLFDYDVPWYKSVVAGKRNAPYFISTEGERAERKIKLYQDKGEKKAGGRATEYLASRLPKTVLSTINTRDSPSALLARREMESWRLLQLEPSALRQPDSFVAKSRLGTNGSNMAATLNRLARLQKNGHDGHFTSDFDETHTYGQIANRLSALIRDVRSIGIDRNEIRELLTLQMTALDGTTHSAQSLSDGTLRFLALAVLEMDPEERGVICMEEPENGIHPARIPAMLKLLQDIAVNTDLPISADNPLRQVIINTHSPVVVQQIDDQDLLVAESRETNQNGKRFQRVCFGCLPDTWRNQAPNTPEIARGTLIAYLDPASVAPAFQEHEVVVTAQDTIQNGTANGHKVVPSHPNRRRRVIDRDDLQLKLPDFETV